MTEQAELAAQVEHLRRLTRSLEEAQRLANLGSWEWDITSGGLWWSDEVYRIFGTTPQAFPATYEAFLRSIHRDDRDGVEAAVAAVVRSPEASYSVRHRIVRPDGAVRHVHELGEVSWVDGEPVRMLGTVLDVTDRVEVEANLRVSRRATELALEQSRRSEAAERAANERLRELEARKRQFLAALSHELRTPLTVVRGVGETLARLPVEDVETRTRLLRRMDVHARQLSDLIEDLLLVASGDDARPRPAMDVDLCQLVEDVARRTAGDATDRLELRLAEVRLALDVDSTRRMVHALVDNALRYSAPDSVVEVELEALTAGVELRVHDRGPGVPEALREGVFGAFERGGVVVAHSPGVGIGLTVTAACARTHGGQARVDDRPGGGTTVTVRLGGTVG